MIKKILIVDDEQPARELLKSYVEKIPGLEVVAICSNVFEAQQVLQNSVIDILITDIQMGELGGFDLLKLLPQRPITIMCSAYSEYAVDAFNEDVIDYLVKPVDFSRFYKAISKAQKMLGGEVLPKQNLSSVEDIPVAPTVANFVFLKVNQKWQKVYFDEILFFESYGEYIKVHTPQQVLLTLMTMNMLEEKLCGSLFFRVHRTYIINMSKIETIEGYRLFINQHQIPISKNRKDNLFSKIQLLK